MNKAFEVAIDEHSDMVTRICILMLADTIDAQDAYLACFEKLFISLKKGKEIEDTGRWLARVAYNECKSMLRWSARHRVVSLDDLLEPFKKQEELEFMEMLFGLPEKQRNVLYLYYNEGYTTKEIAEITGQREGTVRSQLKRARDRLKAANENEKKGDKADEG